MFATSPALAQKRPNVVMLMTDDTGWNDFGAYTGGGAALGHPTPNIDRIAKEGRRWAITVVRNGALVDLIATPVELVIDERSN